MFTSVEAKITRPLRVLKGNKVVAVVDKNKKPLMPCTEKRARLLMERGQARSRWKGGIFYIQLLKKPSKRKYQKVVVGIDTGSMRESYTVATKNRVCININTNTPNWIKRKIKDRRDLRRSRRYRKTPYRKCRFNRKVKKGWLPPSTKARWQAKLRIVNFLIKLYPITTIGIEDIKAITKKGKRSWNKSFSPLEQGKTWCYEELKKLTKEFILFNGFDNKKYRDSRGFVKIKAKLKPVWEAHCVDSHVMCERLLNNKLNPFKSFNYFEFFKWRRRQLHYQYKNGIRKRDGGTTTCGRPRGTLLQHKKHRLVYLGGYGERGLSIHNTSVEKRLSQRVKLEDCKFLGVIKWRQQYF